MTKRELKTAKSMYVSADELFVDPDDLTRDLQRNPEERKKELIKLYGEHGELFVPEKAGAIVVGAKQRKGKYPIRDGGGRWWAVMNLLKRPKFKLLCVLQEEVDALDGFVSSNAGKRVPEGKIFMALGSDPSNAYEHRVCNVIKRHGFTLDPGHKDRSLRVNSCIFAYDIGHLDEALMMASLHLRQRQDKRIEGIALVAISSLLFLYDKNPGINRERLQDVLALRPYEEHKEQSRPFLPKFKEHQRQSGRALACLWVNDYNHNLRRTPRLPPDYIAKLQSRVEGHEHYHVFAQVWEMRKIVAGEELKDSRKKKKEG